MKKVSEGKKMFFSVMIIFLCYAIIFILFEDYDRQYLQPFDEASDWHLLTFSIVVMLCLSFLLHRYSRKMDDRISRDQSEKEALMRRELTQNIGHELKTPVASILGFTETILENPDLTSDQKTQFIEKSHAQAQRLSALLQDLSTLNRMDYAPGMIEKHKTDVNELVSTVVNDVRISLEKKSMEFKNYLPSSVFVKGNSALLYSIFRNLFDNSINYSGEKSTIELQAHESSGYWHFIFSDNGIGVDTIHLPRLFERFYRVDRGRMRSIGGTGLGLSIVKNAVMLHGGNIKAEQNGESGLRFVFSLRK
jgi:two-component system OmpR family sensor kinase/two-component system phosphate regulon sensor histidine kinase PhoR